MEYRRLGKTGIKVSSLCLGTLTFGKEADESASAAIFHRCREVGINFFDTADSYNGGRAEEILGRLIQDCRGEIILTTKVYYPTGKDINDRGLSRRHIFQAVEGSLRRLKTDWIDIYFLHSFDPDVPMEEVFRAMDDLVRQGKVLYPGVSNWMAWQTAKALGICEREGWAAIQCLQPMYNLVKRTAEIEILPLAEAEKIGVITYGPLGGGLLTGKYRAGQKPEKGRFAENPIYPKRYDEPRYFEIAEKFAAHARAQGVNPAALAVAWVMSHPAVTAPIIGARHEDQLKDSLEALKIKMTPQWRKEISALSIEPPPPTDRTEEREGIAFLGPSKI
jgi:aryl-alcohol dehydrogenase-like predicted oxidoreductase